MKVRARTVVVLAGLLVLLLGALVLWMAYGRQSPLSVHLDNARRLVNGPESYQICRECNRQERCRNGDPYQFYFRSSYGRTLHLSPTFMITVITFPDGTQYFKAESPFDYSRSRLIADAPDTPSFVNLLNDGVDPDQPGARENIRPEYRDIWSIRNAKDHADLRAALEEHGFEPGESAQ